MAIFGIQLIITMIAACILQKLGPFFSFANSLLCKTGLVRYLHPSTSELKSIARIGKENGRKRGSRKHGDHNGDDSSSFLVPKNADFQLNLEPIDKFQVMQLKFYTEFQWLVDFSVCATVVYAVTEFYLLILPLHSETNLSMLWCLMSTLFSFRILFSLCALYTRGGELEVCLLAGFSYLLMALVVLIIQEDTFEHGLDSAYGSFNQSLTEFLENRGFLSSDRASLFAFKLMMAIWSAVVGMCLVFPGFRFARVHADCLKYSANNAAKRLIYELSFIMPMLILIMWIPPVSREYLTERIWPGYQQPLISTELFETIRIWLVIFMVILRMLLLPSYLQSYLNMVHDRIEVLKKEVGKIKSTELQARISNVFYYLCVVALQFTIPLILCFFFILMYKTLGEYSLIGQYNMTAVENSTTNETEQVTLSGLKKLLTFKFYRGVLGYSLWWCCFVMFTSSTFGALIRGIV